MWRFAPKLAPGVPLHSWVYRIAINTCIDRLRSRSRYESKTTRDNSIVLGFPDRDASPQLQAQRAEELRAVKRVLGELTERQRAIFVLRHFQNLKQTEIAETLDTPVGTIKATLHQAIRSRSEY